MNECFFENKPARNSGERKKGKNPDPPEQVCKANRRFCAQRGEYRLLPRTVTLVYYAKGSDGSTVASAPLTLDLEGEERQPGEYILDETTGYYGNDGAVAATINPGMCSLNLIHSWYLTIATIGSGTRVFVGHLDRPIPIGQFTREKGEYQASTKG